MALQGKCDYCKIRYSWGRYEKKSNNKLKLIGDVPISKTKCPNCSSSLSKTNATSRYKTVSVDHTELLF